MKNYLRIYLITAATSLALSVMISGASSFYDIGMGFGTLNLIFGVLLLFAGVIMLLAGSKESGKATLAAGGLILLTGGIFCSVFPLSLNFR